MNTNNKKFLLNKNFVYLDFEYNTTNEQNLNLVCVHLSVHRYTYQPMDYYIWLHKEDRNKEVLKRFLLKHKSKYTFVAYSVEAEGGSLYSLGIDPTKFNWIDLRLEYKMLTNHNHKLAYGPQIIKGKRVTTRPPKPKWEQSEEERRHSNSSKPEHSLVACTFKLLGIDRDQKHKDEMRDLIISAPDKFTDKEQYDIQKYCKDDVEYLPKIHRKMVDLYVGMLNEVEYNLLFKEMLLRGNYGARTAIMERNGYPINVASTRKFTDSIGHIIQGIVEDINSQEYGGNFKPFRWNKPEQRYSLEAKKLRQWASETSHASRWLRTETKDFSIALDAFTQFYPFRHDYPRNNLGAQMVRYLKFKQSINGFLPRPANSKKKSFWDSVGSDGRVRYYSNIYGAQSSRSQPAATAFIPLKSAWMRSLIQPKPGKAICGIDYSSQEFLISALVSGDKNMLSAYRSGDVYLYFAKKAGAVPEEGTREEYEKERDLFKSTVLGISYSMSKWGLSDKLTADTGEVWSPDKAQGLIDDFYKVFHKFGDWQSRNLSTYRKRGRVKLPCGWYMWGDNNNDRSVNNVPIQGFGASIMRKAVELAQEAGLNVSFTLHDAIYIEYNSFEFINIDLLHNCMVSAFIFYFKDKVGAKSIRLDANTWGPDYTEPGDRFTPKGTKVKTQEIYVDKRSKKDYELFKEYL